MKSTILNVFTILCLVFGLAGCSLGKGALFPNAVTLTPFTTTKIDRRPDIANYNRGQLTTLGKFDPASGDPFQVDLRSYDLTQLDLSGASDQLKYATFDDKTVWPTADRMPAGFDWKQVMEIGKNPGLGVRGLHDQGITGSGVGIAILDNTLQVDHPEYRDQIKLYEEINFDPATPADMHGPAVASIAVGKTIGVAPGAELFFIADWFVDPDTKVNFTYLAQGIRRILEINRSLPEGRKIRVISISREFGSQERGYSDLMAAIMEADKQGIPVISVRMFGSKQVSLLGLGRDPLADPDKTASYKPGVILEPNLDIFTSQPEQLWIPIDARTTASPTGTQDYAFYGVGGISWAEPYLAGIYALACQVYPKITPDQFWKLVRDTGSYVDVQHNGKQVKLGPIINPPGLIKALKTNG